MSNLIDYTIDSDNTRKGKLVTAIKTGDILSEKIIEEPCVSPNARAVTSKPLLIDEEDSRCLLPVELVSTLEEATTEKKISCIITNKSDKVVSCHDSTSIAYASNNNAIYETHPFNQDNTIRLEEDSYKAVSSTELTNPIVHIQDENTWYYCHADQGELGLSKIYVLKKVNKEIVWKTVLSAPESPEWMHPSIRCFRIIGDLMYIVTATHLEIYLAIYVVNKNTGVLVKQDVVGVDASEIIPAESEFLWIGYSRYLTIGRLMDFEYNVYSYDCTESYNYSNLRASYTNAFKSCVNGRTYIVREPQFESIESSSFPITFLTFETKSTNLINSFAYDCAFSSKYQNHKILTRVFKENFYLIQNLYNNCYWQKSELVAIKIVKMDIYGGVIFSHEIDVQSYTKDLTLVDNVEIKSHGILFSLKQEQCNVLIYVDTRNGSEIVKVFRKSMYISDGIVKESNFRVHHWDVNKIVVEMDDTVTTLDNNLNILCSAEIPHLLSSVDTDPYAYNGCLVEENKFVLALRGVNKKKESVYAIQTLDLTKRISLDSNTTKFLRMGTKDLNLWGSIGEKKYLYNYKHFEDNGECLVCIPNSIQFLEHKEIMLIANNSVLKKKFNFVGYETLYGYSCFKNGDFAVLHGLNLTSIKICYGNNFNLINTSSKYLNLGTTQLEDIHLSTDRKFVIITTKEYMYIYNFEQENLKKVIFPYLVMCGFDSVGNFYVGSFVNSQLNISKMSKEGLVIKKKVYPEIKYDYYSKMHIYKDNIYLFIKDSKTEGYNLFEFSTDLETYTSIIELKNIPSSFCFNKSLLHVTIAKQNTFAYSLDTKKVLPYKLLTGNIDGENIVVLNDEDKVSYFLKDGIIIGKTFFLNKSTTYVKTNNSIIFADMYTISPQGELLKMNLNIITS